MIDQKRVFYSIANGAKNELKDNITSSLTNHQSSIYNFYKL
jgi:hypothetical protein